MRQQISTLLFLPIFFLALGFAGAEAGPLDRQSQEYRRNPAADNMLRVPGVMGLDNQKAVCILQQAGLNPKVNILRETEATYAGREGQIVKQIPAPGGMAMLGSSVTLTLYAPQGGTVSRPSNGDHSSDPSEPADAGRSPPNGDHSWHRGDKGRGHGHFPIDPRERVSPRQGPSRPPGREPHPVEPGWRDAAGAEGPRPQSADESGNERPVRRRPAPERHPAVPAHRETGSANRGHEATPAHRSVGPVQQDHGATPAHRRAAREQGHETLPTREATGRESQDHRGPSAVTDAASSRRAPKGSDAPGMGDDVSLAGEVETKGGWRRQSIDQHMGDRPPSVGGSFNPGR